MKNKSDKTVESGTLWEAHPSHLLAMNLKVVLVKKVHVVRPAARVDKVLRVIWDRATRIL